MAKKTQTPLSQICFRQYAKTEKRKVGDAVDDPIADKLARAQSAEDMAKVAIEGGIPREIVEEKAAKAPNPGQFRMTLGNLLRGVLSRIEQYHTLTGGRVDAADVGTKKLFQAKMAEWRKSQKPVKDGKNPSSGTKKSATKKGGKVAAAKSKPAGDDKPAAASKGAPSKSEAAARGKGKKDGGSGRKSRWQRNKASKSARDDAAAPSVDGTSGEAGEQTGLADAVADANA